MNSMNFHERLLNHHNTKLGSISMSGYIPKATGISKKKMRLLGKYAVVYILKGKGRFGDNLSHDISFKEGSLLYLFPKVSHFYEPIDEESWDEIHFIFSGPQFDFLEKRGILDPQNPVRQLEPISYWRNRFFELIGNPKCSNERQGLGEVLKLSGILSEIDCLEGYQNHELTDDAVWLDRAKSLIINYQQVDIDYNSISRRMNLSYETFRKRFTGLAGLSPGRYHVRILMEKAVSLIIHDRLSNKAIADELGFCDEFHFSKRFRSVMGMSPRAYRLYLPTP